MNLMVLAACLDEHVGSQRDLARVTNLSLGSVNKALQWLKSEGLLTDDEKVTAKGKKALEPYKVQNAVILAAGMGARIAPFSYERPKALLEVRGEVLIERLINQLKERGIDDIVVVVGYMRESLFYLEDKYGVKLLTAADYANRNSHASLLRAKDELRNSLILPSDQYYEDNWFVPYMFESTCFVTDFEQNAQEYSVTINRAGHIVSAAYAEGNEHCVVGPVYLNAEDSQKLAAIIQKEYDRPETVGKFWEQILMEHLREFTLAAVDVPSGGIHEFDFFKDLCSFDTDFILNVDSSILDNICQVFECGREAIDKIEPISEGLTNLSFLFCVNNEPHVYRHPGNGTEAIISREAEELALRIAKKLGLDDTFVYEDPKVGWKVSRFIPGCVPFEYENPDHVKRAMEMARQLHTSGETSPFTFDPYSEALKIVELLRKDSYPLPHDFADLSGCIDELAKKSAQDASEPVLCHNDFYGPNFLVHDGQMDLIDWEYAAMGDYANDIGNFVSQGSGYSIEQAEAILDDYFGRKPTAEEVRHCMACVAIVGYYWYVWAMYKEAQGNPVGEWLDIWYRAARQFGRHALGLYEDVNIEAAPALTRDEFDALVARYEQGTATKKELAALEPYRARRAVLFASGFGSRMMPITINTPKPLVRVKGRRIIESILDALLGIGVEEIMIVRGYLKDEFDILKKSYPMIRFVDNPVYDTTNNISSAAYAVEANPHAFENAYAFESDLYLKNPDIIKRYQWTSNYLGVPVDETPDWCFDVEDGVIVDLHKGGTDCCHMFGVSYWDASGGAQLAKDLPAAFAREECQQRFWDDVPCVIYRENFTVELRACTFEDIDEIDSFAELREIDPAYKTMGGC